MEKKMSKKIIGIVLVVAALVTAALAVKITAHAPRNAEIIKSAVLVEDGRVLSENEGKVVIVHGKLTAELPFVDKETGIKLDTIVAYRRVEKLSSEYDSEKEKDYWQWNTVSDPQKLGGSGKVIAPGVSLGEFAVDDAFVLAIAANENRVDYDKKELSRKGWNTFEDNNRTYLYQGEHMPSDNDRVTEKYARDYVDTMRVAYDEMAEKDASEYTLIGVQKGGTLQKAEKLDMLATHSGHLTMEEILSYEESSSKTAMITSFVIAALLLAGGIFLIAAGKKSRR